jgi:hypothetical protein
MRSIALAPFKGTQKLYSLIGTVWSADHLIQDMRPPGGVLEVRGGSAAYTLEPCGGQPAQPAPAAIDIFTNHAFNAHAPVKLLIHLVNDVQPITFGAPQRLRVSVLKAQRRAELADIAPEGIGFRLSPNLDDRAPPHIRGAKARSKHVASLSHRALRKLSIL